LYQAVLSIPIKPLAVALSLNCWYGTADRAGIGRLALNPKCSYNVHGLVWDWILWRAAASESLCPLGAEKAVSVGVSVSRGHKAKEQAVHKYDSHA
jgi:hypothetical protein